MYVTEDTTRADPDTLRAIYQCAIRAGAKRICIADTVGHATPAGATAVVRFVAQVIADSGRRGRHRLARPPRPRPRGDEQPRRARGRRDARARDGARHRRARRQHADGLAARQPGDDGLQAVRPRARSSSTARVVAEACGVPIPDNYPIVGRDAFRTATGVHAAAVIKAWKKGDRELMDMVYSAVPASLVGREQEIDVGPMSGKSNVIFWLREARHHRDRPDRRPRVPEGQGVGDDADRRRDPRGGYQD